MEITYDYYRIFYYAAKYKSFSKAAEILMSNQPNITHFMNNLENQLGCRLFIRSNRGVTLTREGEKLYKHVTIAYQHFQLAELELANDKSLQSGIITVGVSEIALHLLILQVMADFRKAYPGIRIRLSNHSTPETIQEVLDVMIKLAKENITMVVVTHEMGFARQVADRVVFMADGQIIEEGTPDHFFENPSNERVKQFLGKIIR